MKQKIGILGGTFDPVHLGHLYLANYALQKHQLQQIQLIPCNQSPLRDQPIASAFDRLNMLKLAIADQPQLVVNDLEIKRPGISYMYETLQELCVENKTAEFFLIMGADAYDKFNQWYKWKDILELSRIIVADRLPISSTQIRAMIKNNEDVKMLLSNSVWQYIKDNNLYKI